MPPKEKEKEVAPPPEPSIDDLLTAVAEDSTAERHICEIIDELITATEEEVRLKRIRNAGVAHTVTGIMSDITVVLKCYFNECDPGEPEIRDATGWMPDVEPRPAEIDSWSRGAVPAKRRDAVLATAPVGSGAAAVASLGGDTARTGGINSQRRGSNKPRRPSCSQLSGEEMHVEKLTAVFVAKVNESSQKHMAIRYQLLRAHLSAPQTDTTLPSHPLFSSERAYRPTRCSGTSVRVRN